MRLDDFPAQEQAEPAALSNLLGRKERLDGLPDMFGRHPAPVVVHRQDGHVPRHLFSNPLPLLRFDRIHGVLFRGQQHLATRRRRRQGVGQQAGALGAGAMILSGGTVIYGTPSAGPLADSAYVMPGAVRVGASDLRAIVPNITPGISVYFY